MTRILRYTREDVRLFLTQGPRLWGSRSGLLLLETEEHRESLAAYVIIRYRISANQRQQGAWMEYSPVRQNWYRIQNSHSWTLQIVIHATGSIWSKFYPILHRRSVFPWKCILMLSSRALCFSSCRYTERRETANTRKGRLSDHFVTCLHMLARKHFRWPKYVKHSTRYGDNRSLQVYPFNIERVRITVTFKFTFHSHV